ncbi:MAG: paraquat-inducible protein A [Xanthomonadales bacterium]|nr:paraquat-inducible protein A [Xanthomonadales bacterium]
MAPERIILCPTCYQAHRADRLAASPRTSCARCGTVLYEMRRHGAARTLALSIAALIVFVPANIYPILSMEKLGVYSESTIWAGVQSLYRSGYWGVAVLVFAASIVIPLFKLLVLIHLAAFSHHGALRRMHYRLLRFVQVIGPWSMLDVFLVAILVSLVKLGDLATIRPQAGLVAFAAVVVLTLLASASVHPGLLREERRYHDES